MFRFVVLAGLATVGLTLSGCGEAPEVTAPAPIEQAPVVQQVEPAPVSETTPEPAPGSAEPVPAVETGVSSRSADSPEDAAVNSRGWQPGQHEEFVSDLRDHLREEGIHPNYGVADGSVDGPGYLDPDAYGGGPSSGEAQREWLEQQGLL